MYTEKWYEVENILKYNYNLKELLSKIIFPYLIAKASTPMDKVIVNQVAHNCNVDEILLRYCKRNSYRRYEQIFDIFVKYEFTIDEIMIICTNSSKSIPPLFLIPYFNNGGKKADLILNLIKNN